MMPYLLEEYGNAGSLHTLGRKAKDAVEHAREQVCSFFGADDPKQVIFTSGATESNNMVFGNAKFKEESGKDTIIVSAYEHESVLRPAERFGGNCVMLLPGVDGIIYTDDFKEAVMNNKDRLALASVMYVNNEVGSVNNIEEMADVCKWCGVEFHTDCVQAASTKVLKAKEIGCDYMSISSHKIHGPKGIGALYMRDINSMHPMILGGRNQEFGMRGGTENVPSIVGFGKACELMKEHLESKRSGYTVKLKKKFWVTLVEKCKSHKIEEILSVNALSNETESATLSIRFSGVDAETLVLFLSERFLYISAGSACTSLEQKPSHVLKAIGLGDDEARETIRVSFSRLNTEGEVVQAASTIARTASFLYNIAKGS